MAIRSGGPGLRPLKSVLAVPLSILGLIAVYTLVGPVDRALSRLSGTVELIVVLAAGGFALGCVLLTSDRAARYRDRVRSAAARAKSGPAPAARPPVVPKLAPRGRTDAPVVRDTVDEVSSAVTGVVIRADVALQGEAMSSSALAEPSCQQVSAAHVLADASRACVESAAEVARVLERLAGMCSLLADRLDENGRENRALAEFILRVTPSSNSMSHAEFASRCD